MLLSIRVIVTSFCYRSLLMHYVKQSIYSKGFWYSALLDLDILYLMHMCKQDFSKFDGKLCVMSTYCVALMHTIWSSNCNDLSITSMVYLLFNVQ